MYVMHNATLMGVSRAEFMSANAALPFKARVAAQLHSWGFVGITEGMVSVVTMTDTLSNVSCVIPVRAVGRRVRFACCV